MKLNTIQRKKARGGFEAGVALWGHPLKGTCQEKKVFRTEKTPRGQVYFVGIISFKMHEAVKR